MTNVFQNIHYSAIAEPWQISSHAKQRPCDLQDSPGLLHRHHHLNYQSQRLQLFPRSKIYFLSAILSSFFSPVLFPLWKTFSVIKKCSSLFLSLLVQGTRPKISFSKICLLFLSTSSPPHSHANFFLYSQLPPPLPLANCRAMFSYLVSQKGFPCLDCIKLFLLRPLVALYW